MANGIISLLQRAVLLHKEKKYSATAPRLRTRRHDQKTIKPSLGPNNYVRKDRRTQSNEDEVKYVLEVKSFVMRENGKTSEKNTKKHEPIRVH